MLFPSFAFLTCAVFVWYALHIVRLYVRGINMKKKDQIKNAVVHMYIERARWEREKAKKEGIYMMDVGWSTPRIEYLPGKGFSVNGVEWPYNAEYIIDHFMGMAYDYKTKADELEFENGMNEGAPDESDIPF